MRFLHTGPELGRRIECAEIMSLRIDIIHRLPAAVPSRMRPTVDRVGARRSDTPSGEERNTGVSKVVNTTGPSMARSSPARTEVPNFINR